MLGLITSNELILLMKSCIESYIFRVIGIAAVLFDHIHKEDKYAGNKNRFWFDPYDSVTMKGQNCFRFLNFSKVVDSLDKVFSNL